MATFDDIAEALSIPRSRIEAAATGPTVITVTSATAGDGKSLLAYGLAHSFGRVGHSVLLVDGNEQATGYCPIPPAPQLSALADYDLNGYIVHKGHHRPSLLNLASPGVKATCSKENVLGSFGLFRSKFAFVVVEIPLLSESGTALSYASCSDGVILALRKGRAATRADRDLVEVLRSAAVPILGVVTENPKHIKALDGAWRPESSTRISVTPEESLRQSASRPIRSR